MEKFRNGRHTDSCLTWSHTIFGRAFKFIKQRRFQVDYACAFLHIFVFNNVVAWPLLLCFSIFPPDENTWHTPTSADRTSTAGARASTVEYSRSHFFFPKLAVTRGFLIYFLLFCLGRQQQRDVFKELCGGVLCFIIGRMNRSQQRKRLGFKTKTHTIRQTSEKIKKLFCQVAGWLGCRYIGRIGRSLYGPAAREITVLGMIERENCLIVWLPSLFFE
jgi:hypothetical protein